MMQLYSFVFGTFCGYAYTYSLITSVQCITSWSLRSFLLHWLLRYGALGITLYTAHQYYGCIIPWWMAGFSIIFIWNLRQKTEVMP